MADLCERGAVQLAALIRDGDVTSREVVAAHVERIHAANAEVNALTRVLDDEAFVAADAVDGAIARGEAVGPLAGVPFTVKENIDVAGTPTTQGVVAFADALAARDAPMVEHLRGAGAIPIGRTNLPDMAFRWHTHSGIAGATRNPWDPSRTPGGSSGGEAAALALRMTPLGLGNDLGGSLRWPAQACGVVSLRPSLGRIPDATCVEPSTPPMFIQVMNCQGPLARHVEDLSAAFAVMAAPHPADPFCAPVPLVGAPAVRPIRVAVVADPLGGGVDPQVAGGVARAADVLADAGYELHEIEPPMLAEAATTWGDLVAAETALLWPLLEMIMCESGAQFVRAAMAHLGSRDQEAQMAAWMTRLAVGRVWSAFQDEYPLILAPISTLRPWAADWDVDHVAEALHAMRMVVPVNVLGLPAVTVPVGVDEGLPQAVQLIGRRWREDLCLDAAATIERVCGTLPMP